MRGFRGRRTGGRQEKGPSEEWLAAASAEIIRSYIIDSPVESTRGEHGARGADPEELAAALVILVLKRFDVEADSRAVGKFISDYNRRSVAADRLPPRDSEALIRAILGDAHLLDFISKSSARAATPLLLKCLVKDMSLSSGDVDVMLQGADRLAYYARMFAIHDAQKRGSGVSRA
jgi:hypothetical protein